LKKRSWRLEEEKLEDLNRETEWLTNPRFEMGMPNPLQL
jgi:hypothetical protein